MGDNGKVIEGDPGIEPSFLALTMRFLGVIGESLGESFTYSSNLLNVPVDTRAYFLVISDRE
jgi:hypothetical protein